jgi:putative membrane protein
MSKSQSGIRLHPSSPLFLIIELIKSFFFPLVIALFAGGGDRYEMIGALFVIPGIIVALLQYSVYRYQLLDKEIVIREGVFVKTVRHIKYERIQNLNLTRNPLHRLLGVAQLELESASGGKPEAIMRVVSLAAVDDIRQKVLQARAGAKTPDTEDDINLETGLDKSNEILAIPLSELIKAGIISNKGMLVVAFFFGLMAQTRATDKFFDQLEDYLEPLFNGISFDLSQPVSIVLLALLGVVAFFIVIRILSIIFMVFTYFGFLLTQNGDKLQASYGLVTQFNATVPQQRIQQITITKNILHTYFKRAAVRIATAGGMANNPQGGKSLKWIAPIIPADKADEFISIVQPELSFDVIQWNQVPFRAWRRVTRFFSFYLIVVITGLYFVVSWYSLWLLILLPLIVLYSRRLVASMRYGFTHNALVYESGWLIKHKTYVPINKIQSVSFSQTPFDRRNNMARVAIDVAGVDATQHHINIRYLDIDVAENLFDEIYRKVSATEYRWK